MCSLFSVLLQLQDVGLCEGWKGIDRMGSPCSRLWPTRALRGRRLGLQCVRRAPDVELSFTADRSSPRLSAETNYLRMT